MECCNQSKFKLIINLKILLISSSPFSSTYGGGQVYFRNIVDELLRQKIEIYIGEPGEKQIKTETYNGATVYVFQKDGTESDFIHFLEEVKPDRVHAHGYKAQFAKACNILSIPCIITAHHGGILCPAGSLLNHKDVICAVKSSHKNCLPCVLKNIQGGSWAYPLLKQIPEQFALSISQCVKKAPFIPYFTPVMAAAEGIHKKVTDWEIIGQYASLVIAPSVAIAKAMTLNGLPADKLKIVPHGIPLPQALSRKKGMNKRPQFFYLGRINRVKGLHVLLKAMKSVKIDIDLHIFGDAVSKEEKRYLKELQNKSKGDQHIKWRGAIPMKDVYSTIKDMDAMIHPTICMEIYGLNIAESLALGIPVIASRCGGAEMQIKHGWNGLLVEPNNTEELAQAIQHTIEKKITFDMSSIAVKDIKEHVKVLLKIYEEVVD